METQGPVYRLRYTPKMKFCRCAAKNKMASQELVWTDGHALQCSENSQF